MKPPRPMPPKLWDARCKACWFTAGLLLLVAASFWSLDLQWAAFLSADALQRMARFAAEFWPPAQGEAFLRKLLPAAWETLAMSLLGTLLAAALGLLLALPASRGGAARALAAVAQQVQLVAALQAFLAQLLHQGGRIELVEWHVARAGHVLGAEFRRAAHVDEEAHMPLLARAGEARGIDQTVGVGHCRVLPGGMWFRCIW